MFLSLLFALLPTVEAVPVAPAADPVIRLTINNDRRFLPGDPVRVRVETGRAGHLLVLHYTPAGDVKVLFPIAPADFAAVQAGRRYEIRDESTAQSFLAAGRGPGLILSVLAEDPFRLESFTAGGEWDAGALAIPRDSRDPESDLVALVQRMASPKGFDYDALDYAVFGPVASDDADVEVPAWWSPTYVMAGGWGDCFGCGYWGPGGVLIGVNIGWGWGWGGYYPPYYTGWPCCGYGWAGYGYGYGYGWDYGGYYPPYYPPYYPGWGGGHGHYGPGAAIIGRPRGYNVIPLDQEGGRPRSGVGSTRTAGERGAMPNAPPARRARGGGSGGGARPDGGNEGANPSQGGKSGGGSKPNAGGQPREPQRARPRGSRPPADDLRIANDQSARPESRTQQGWVRVEDASPAARPREGISRNGAFTERARTGGSERAGRTDVGSNRIDLAPARRVSRSDLSAATRGRGDWQRSGQTSRAATPQQSRGGNEGRSARPSGAGAGRGSVSRPSGGGGGGHASRPSGGGGGRSRGRP